MRDSLWQGFCIACALFVCLNLRQTQVCMRADRDSPRRPGDALAGHAGMRILPQRCAQLQTGRAAVDSGPAPAPAGQEAEAELPKLRRQDQVRKGLLFITVQSEYFF